MDDDGGPDGLDFEAEAVELGLGVHGPVAEGYVDYVEGPLGWGWGVRGDGRYENLREGESEELEGKGGVGGRVSVARFQGVRLTDFPATYASDAVVAVKITVTKRLGVPNLLHWRFVMASAISSFWALVKGATCDISNSGILG